MQNRILKILTSVLLAFSGASSASHCVLPVPDGSDVEPSPPSLIGTVLSVAPGTVLVRVSGAEQAQPVAVNPTTGLFTVYGGGIEFGDLHPGQPPLIWFEGFHPPTRNTPVAACLQGCSLALEPCPSL